MRSDEVAHDFAPGLHDFRFVQSLFQAKPLHQFRQHVDRRLPTIRPRKSFRQTAPLSDCGSAKRGRHGVTEYRSDGVLIQREMIAPIAPLRYYSTTPTQYLRRMLLGRMFSSVRYFATVRRAIGIPRLLKISTISLSLNGPLPSSLFTKSRMASFTLVLLIDSPLEV